MTFPCAYPQCHRLFWSYRIANLLGLWKADPFPEASSLTLSTSAARSTWNPFPTACGQSSKSQQAVWNRAQWPVAKHLESKAISSWPCPGTVRTLTCPLPGTASGILKPSELQQNAAERKANRHHQQRCITLHTEFESVSYFSKRKMGYLTGWKSYNFSSECTCLCTYKMIYFKIWMGKQFMGLTGKNTSFPKSCFGSKRQHVDGHGLEHPFSQYLLSAYYMAGTVLGARNKWRAKVDMSLLSWCLWSICYIYI